MKHSVEDSLGVSRHSFVLDEEQDPASNQGPAHETNWVPEPVQVVAEGIQRREISREEAPRRQRRRSSLQETQGNSQQCQNPGGENRRGTEEPSAQAVAQSTEEEAMGLADCLR